MFALVAPLGTDLDRVSRALVAGLKAFNYSTTEIRLSSFLNLALPEADRGSLHVESEAERLSSFMAGGRLARSRSRQGAFLALCAIQDISGRRAESAPLQDTAFILRSLKHPDEVTALRRVYGAGFFLVGVHAPKAERLEYLVRQGIPRAKAEELIDVDEAEADDPVHGQRTRDTFHLADVFVELADELELRRALALIFGDPFQTPKSDEHAMFIAYAASLRSADLSRQVGAAIVSAQGDLVATGANDVPTAGGGPYWPGPEDVRDHVQGQDPNQKLRNDIILDVMKRVNKVAKDDESQNSALLEEGETLLKGSLLMDVTEYGRAVHAEMDAILSCGRSGVSSRGATLFCTTFPCHNCAKHIVDAGVQRVVYIEPYPKSRASELHSDAISFGDPNALNKAGKKKVSFEPFTGVAPRRYSELFAMVTSTGETVHRKKKGKAITWDPGTASVRVPMRPVAYLDREKHAATELEKAKEMLRESKQA